jgi:type II secretory pathway component PulF
MAIGIGLFTVTNLIPKLQALSEQMGGQTNWLTECMLTLADFAVFELPILIALLVIVGFSFRQWRKNSSEGRLKSDNWLLRIPLAGSIIRNINLSKSFATLHLLLKNGISSIDAMRLSAYAINNEVIRHRFLEARSALQDGASFASAFKRTEVIPPRDLDLIGIGESTGSLLSTLERLAHLHSQALSKDFKKLTLIVSTCALSLAVSLVALLIFAIVVSLQGVSESILTR